MLLSKRLVDIERQCCEKAQYATRKCHEVVGIPDSVQNKEFEREILTIFKKTGREVYPSDRHDRRLKKDNEKFIVKFSLRKNCYK